MKKIIKKTFSLALAVCMLCSLNVFASADESASIDIVAQKVAYVKHTKSTNVLSVGTVTSEVKNINGSGVNTPGYRLTDATSGRSAMADIERLYLEFDLTTLKGWEINSASFSFNIKSSATGAKSTVKIYNASEINCDLSKIHTTDGYANDVSALTSIANNSNNLVSSFDVKGNGTGAIYDTDPGVRISVDVKSKLEELLLSGKDSVILVFEFYAGKDNNQYNAYIAAETTAYAPALSVTGTPRTTFSVSDVETVAGTNPVVYNYTNSEQIEVTEDMSILNNSANGYHRVFVTFDLTGIDKNAIEMATFKNEGYRSAGVQSLKITKVTTPFNPADNTYVLDETSAVYSTDFAWGSTFGWSTVTADLTTMIKNCEGNSLTVCIENTSGTGGLRFAVTSEDYQNPALDLVFASETATELSTLAEGTAVTAQRFVQIGSADAPQSAVPIIALYEDGELSSIKIGEAISLDGTGQTVSASVTATETLSNPKATFFLWTSLQELVPLMESSSIE